MALFGSGVSVEAPRPIGQNADTVKTSCLKNQYWTVLTDTRAKVAFLERSPEPFPSVQDLKTECALVIRQFRPEFLNWGVVVDMRQGPIRHMPGIEEGMAELRMAISRSFARVAVVVSTQAGLLQVRRITKGDGAESFVTADADAALTFARTGTIN